jgi:hypothetical protein
MFVLIIAVSTGCDSVGRTEIRRVTSPDSRVDAVLVEGSAGATTGFSYEVYVLPKGGGVVSKEGALLSKDDPVLRISYVGALENLGIEWTRPKLLAISYKSAWIHHFTNRWSWSDGKGSSYVVELRLVPPAGNEFALPETRRF